MTLVFLEVSVSVVFYTVIPRFVISIRELYDRDIRGRFHVDTGFGAVSRLNSDLDTTVSVVVFADVNRGDTDDLELGRMHGSGLNEDSPIEAVESTGERSESSEN
ncbi:hypothetical protein EV363DRAFT_1196355 [Boletus edulis]|nr:hypothetical protein EV363DRAFT_1196355 [Boletus edulis]